jgi:hypothetical protein
MINLSNVLRAALIGFAIQGIGLSGWFFCKILELRTSFSLLDAVFMKPDLSHSRDFYTGAVSLSHALLFWGGAYIIQLWRSERILILFNSIFFRSSICGFAVLFMLDMCDMIFASGRPPLSIFHPILILGYCTGNDVVIAISFFCEGVILAILFAAFMSHRIRHRSITIALLGIIFTVMSCSAVTWAILGEITSLNCISLGFDNPLDSAVVIGETVIDIIFANINQGLLAILPATLLYIAFGLMRFRARWFCICTFASSLYFLVLLPFGTVCGIILLVELRRSRQRASSIPPNPAKTG